MGRLDRIKDPDEFEAERQRELLRRMQWGRWERLLLTVGFAFALIASGVHGFGFLAAVLRWIA